MSDPAAAPAAAAPPASDPAARDVADGMAPLPAGTRTEIAPPRQRDFLPQTVGDRVRGFLWSIARVPLFRWSPPAARRWRNWVLRRFGARVHPSAFVAASALIEYPWNLTIAEEVVICDHVIINCMGEVRVGGHTRISQFAHLCAGTHDYQRRDMRIVRSPILVGRQVWIAADAFVGPGVALGDGCLLAARSSAFHDLPGGQICVGEPARAVKKRFD